MRLVTPFALFLPIFLLVPGCDDPSPIFGGGFNPGGTPGSLGAKAYLPDDGEWVLPGAPILEEMIPTGAGAHSQTPIVLRFSESMAGASLTNSLVLSPATGGLPVLATINRVGDGRLVVLLPQDDLDAGETYNLNLLETATLTDLTGQAFGATGILGQFTVAASNPATPQVLTTFPPNGTTGESAIGEITTIFDRPMNGATFTDTSFEVLAAGAPPTFDPAPAALDIGGGLFALTDTRVWRWISVNGAGDRESVGDSTIVDLIFSAGGTTLLDQTGGVLPATTITFETAAIAPPSSATITSAPTDAIGIANLTGGSGTELEIEVNFLGGLAGDVVGLFVFGTDTGMDANTVAVAREITLAADADVATFALADLDLVTSTSPLEARFVDGSLTFAFQLRRGSLVTPIRSLDVDAAANGVQAPILDTVAPELVEVDRSPDGGTTLYSDLRGLSISGMASEEIRAAEVVTTLGDNLASTDVLGGRTDGGFLTSPVALDVVSPASLPLTFNLTIFDRALNPQATPKVGIFQQKGVVGPAALGVGADIELEVFDAETLAPIVGARIFTHSNDGATYPVVAVGSTNTAGELTIPSSATDPTILTVDVDGYDIVSMVGVESTRLSIPLHLSTANTGTVSGNLTASSDLANLTLSSLTHRYGSSYGELGDEPLFPGSTCLSSPFGGGDVDCPFGPEPIVAGAPGALSMLAGAFLVDEGSFNALTVLQAFDLELPLPSVGSGDELDVPVAVSLLAEPGADPLALPIEVANPSLNTAALSIIDLGNLDGDAAVSGDARVQLESLVDGIPGAVPVGIGVSYDQGGNQWTTHTAVSAAVFPGGALAGILDPDLFVHAELRDTALAQSVRRPRLSLLGTLPTPNQLDFQDPAAITSPVAAATTTGAHFTVAFTNSIPDSLGQPGLHRVRIEDTTNRAWLLYLSDPADGAAPEVHLPNIALSGGTPLTSGSLTATVESFTYPAFDPGNFLWSDLEREFDLYTKSAPITFTQP